MKGHRHSSVAIMLSVEVAPLDRSAGKKLADPMLEAGSGTCDRRCWHCVASSTWMAVLCPLAIPAADGVLNLGYDSQHAPQRVEQHSLMW